MHTINGHTVEFTARGQIIVDGAITALGINAANGGHYTYIREDGALSKWREELRPLAGRKITGPRRPIGSYEGTLATEIVETLFSA